MVTGMAASMAVLDVTQFATYSGFAQSVNYIGSGASSSRFSAPQVPSGKHALCKD
jgi:hypothetical protein